MLTGEDVNTYIMIRNMSKYDLLVENFFLKGVKLHVFGTSMEDMGVSKCNSFI